MWKNERQKAPVAAFLGWLLLVSAAVNAVLLLLEPYSVAYSENGVLTLGYAVYALIGLLFSTPSPVVALFITLRRKEKITVREFLGRFLETPRPVKTILITGGFCLAAFVFALVYGERNGSPWYLMPLGCIIMLPFVGFAEETGWRGFLQPALEKKLPFPAATVIVAVIWWAWHLVLWVMPSSNHYGDSIIGFAITIFVWAFAAAAIYRATKSVLACAFYHAFINSIGAIWDWNSLFDAFPKENGMWLWFGAVFAASLIITAFSGGKRKDN